MSKQDFLALLRGKLHGLSENDIEECLAFYNEMIDNRTEEGLSEEEAISAIGSVDDIAEQIISETPLAKTAKEGIKPKRRFKTWEIVLLALGSPIWLALGISAIAIVFSLYISLWAIVISLWAVFASLAAYALGSISASIVFAFKGEKLTALTVSAAGIICAGLSIFIFFGCKSATKGIMKLTKKIALHIKKSFINKEEA